MPARLLSFVALAGLAVPSSAQACSTTLLDRLLARPLPAKADREIDVAQVASAEGGSWQLYGRRPVRQIARTDYGEMGRTRLRLVLASPGTYGIHRTRTDYAAPIADPGHRVRRVRTATWRFCAGEVQRPPAMSDAAFAAYRAAALEAKAVFAAAEIRPYLEGAGL